MSIPPSRVYSWSSYTHMSHIAIHGLHTSQLSLLLVETYIHEYFILSMIYEHIPHDLRDVELMSMLFHVDLSLLPFIYLLSYARTHAVSSIFLAGQLSEGLQQGAGPSGVQGD